jgi:hypothetical protein
MKRTLLATLALGFFLSLTSSAANAFQADVDGDGKSDLVIYRPAYGQWFVYPSSGVSCSNLHMTSDGIGGCYVQWGLATDTPIVGDWDGDGAADLAVVRSDGTNLTWYIYFPKQGTNTNFMFGLYGDVVDANDVNLVDGLSDAIVYRPVNDTFYVRYYDRVYNQVTVTAYPLNFERLIENSLTHIIAYTPVTTRFLYSNSHAQPGMGFTTYQPGNGDYGMYFAYVDTQTNSVTSYGEGYFGIWPTPVAGNFVTGTDPSQGDFTDWHTSGGLGYWHKFKHDNTSFTDVGTVQWGLAGDVPVTGDFDGDGLNDLTVWRPTSGTWFIKPSAGTCPSYTTPTTGGCYKAYGLSNDIPVGGTR